MRSATAATRFPSAPPRTRVPSREIPRLRSRSWARWTPPGSSTWVRSESSDVFTRDSTVSSTEKTGATRRAAWLCSRGKRRQAKSRNASRSVMRRTRRLRRRSLDRTPAGSRRRGSRTRSCSAAIHPTLRLVRLLVLVEGADDLADQIVADHVALGQVDELDPGHAMQYLLDLHQPRCVLLPEVDLRDVPGDHGLGPVAQPREEHLHLSHRRVLGLIQDDERVVERAPAHVRERRHLDHAQVQEAADLLEGEKIVQGVVEGP